MELLEIDNLDGNGRISMDSFQTLGLPNEAITALPNTPDQFVGAGLLRPDVHLFTLSFDH
jgi:hypothetical protein